MCGRCGGKVYVVSLRGVCQKIEQEVLQPCIRQRPAYHRRLRAMELIE